jgi:hypothetical protein
MRAVRAVGSKAAEPWPVPLLLGVGTAEPVPEVPKSSRTVWNRRNYMSPRTSTTSGVRPSACFFIARAQQRIDLEDNLGGSGPVS